MPGPPKRPAPPPSTVPGEPEHTVEAQSTPSGSWTRPDALTSLPPATPRGGASGHRWEGYDEFSLPARAARSADRDVGEDTLHMRTRPMLLQREKTRVLRVVAGRDLLQFIALYPGIDILVGRDELDCQLHLSDASVSRRHCRITMSDDQTVIVHDLGSTNGTSIDGRHVDRGFLQVNGVLEVGAVSMRLEELTDKEIGHLKAVLDEIKRSNQDPLTGLHTRAWLDDELPGVIARTEKAGLPLSVVLLDIDHFKMVNDRFGHNVGDDVLRGVGRIVLYTIRDGDVAIRYGGEELMVLLAGSTEKGAADAANRVLRDIQSHDWQRTAMGLRVTASAGVAERDPGEKTRAWIERADRALYAAKHRGRNQVVTASN